MEQAPDTQRSPKTRPRASGTREPRAVEAAGTTSRWLARLIAALLLFGLGLITGGSIVHFGLKRPALDVAQMRLAAQTETLAATRGQLIQTENALTELEGRLIVEESTRRGLESTLRATQTDLGRASDTIAFYEQLMPPGPKGALSIRALDVAPAGPHLKYRVLLMRSGANDRAFRGTLRFVAKGTLDGEPVELTLSPAVSDDVPAGEHVIGQKPVDEPSAREQSAQNPPSGDVRADSDIPLEFADLQRSSGLLDIPPGLVVESVTATVLEGRKVRTSRSVELLPGQ